MGLDDIVGGFIGMLDVHLGSDRAVLSRDDAERRRFAYEGKELELRRPTGMRHWGADDKWRLF